MVFSFVLVATRDYPDYYLESDGYGRAWLTEEDAFFNGRMDRYP